MTPPPATEDHDLDLLRAELETQSVLILQELVILLTCTVDKIDSYDEYVSRFNAHFDICQNQLLCGDTAWYYAGWGLRQGNVASHYAWFFDELVIGKLFSSVASVNDVDGFRPLASSMRNRKEPVTRASPFEHVLLCLDAWMQLGMRAGLPFDAIRGFPSTGCPPTRISIPGEHLQDADLDGHLLRSLYNCDTDACFHEPEEDAARAGKTDEQIQRMFVPNCVYGPRGKMRADNRNLLEGTPTRGLIRSELDGKRMPRDGLSLVASRQGNALLSLVLHGHHAMRTKRYDLCGRLQPIERGHYDGSSGRHVQ